MKYPVFLPIYIPERFARDGVVLEKGVSGEETGVLQIAVCDDKASVRNYLEKVICESAADCEVSLFSGGTELCKSGAEPDIVFLEIEEGIKKR